MTSRVPRHAPGKAGLISRRKMAAALVASPVVALGLCARTATVQPNKKEPRPMPANAFVYTEVQVAVPFGNAPWRDRNPVLREQKGLLSKVWLSGHTTNTLGGFDAFNTVENVLDFAINDFPKTAATMNAAFYTRVFDARITEDASRGLNSPYLL